MGALIGGQLPCDVHVTAHRGSLPGMGSKGRHVRQKLLGAGITFLPPVCPGLVVDQSRWRAWRALASSGAHTGSKTAVAIFVAIIIKLTLFSVGRSNCATNFAPSRLV